MKKKASELLQWDNYSFEIANHICIKAFDIEGYQRAIKKRK